MASLPSGELSGSVSRFVARAKERAALNQAYASDPKHKKYAQQVEKCLAFFDNVHEWADFIAFLKQLLKTLQAYMQFKEIPRKIVVAKRLAQCLNPALPSGVHQRALDVYSHIFSVIGSEGLRRDLFLWTSGLFPFFEYAATSVKPALLNIFDIYFIPLQGSLRPVIKAFILSLLPGLEEETGEFFEKVLALLDRLSGTISPSFFLQNVWLVMLTTSSARGTSLNLLSRRLPNLSHDEDITLIVGSDIGLMIRAFAAALEDDNLLVRRGALDLLLTSLRLDSSAVRNASEEDRTILMRAATSVVMRRDLSLNRRLYTWLLGPEEHAEQQISYFRTNGLPLLAKTLRSEMNTPSSEYSETRPYKIFISLLDKWEIGGPLTDTLVLDAFQSLRASIESDLLREELSLTASTLYEAVEPQVVWKHLLSGVISEIAINTSRLRNIKLAQYILNSVFIGDEEVVTVHLPLVLTAITEVLQDQAKRDPAMLSGPAAKEVLSLLVTILAKIPVANLFVATQLPADATVDALGPFSCARVFYGFESDIAIQESVQRPRVPFATVFEDLVALTSECVRNNAPIPRVVFVRGLALMLELVEARLPEKDGAELILDWNPSEWLSLMLSALETQHSTFVEVDRVVSFMIAAHKADHITPFMPTLLRDATLRLVNMEVLTDIGFKLFKYLRPDYSTYHLRSVNLIWALDECTKGHYVESIVAQALASPESGSNEAAYEAFGVFWRLTGEFYRPGFHFKMPLMIVLDTLKSDEPSMRRIGETWMRCNLKSYLRVLDPLLYDLLDPALHRVPSVTKMNGKELRDFSYERPHDQAYLKYVLETMLSVVRFGGQGFGKTTRTTHINRSHHTGLVQRVEEAGLSHSGATYQDVLVEILTRFLQSECKAKRVQTMAPGNAALQATATDLLQALVSRGEVDLPALEMLEAAVIAKLYTYVHVRRLELQNKLLHLLHSIISATTANHSTRRAASSHASGVGAPISSDAQDGAVQSYSFNPLLVHTLVDGISVPSNRPMLQHWLDFILMTIPQFQQSMHAVLGPLSDCVCRQLRFCLSDIQQAGVEDETRDVCSLTTDAEFLMLLNALERLILLNLQTSDAGNVEDDGVPAEKPGGSEGGSGFLGIVTNVFSSEPPMNPPDEQFTTRSPGYRALHEGVRVLFSLWATLTWSESNSWTPRYEALSMINSKTRGRCRRAFEHLFRLHSAEVLESIIDCWNRDKSSAPQAFELVDALTSSAQNLVHMVCESVAQRLPGLSEKARRQVVNPNLSDATLFLFLEQYLIQLEGPLVIQVWGRFLQLARDVLASVKDFKLQAFAVLRCVSVLASKLTQTTAMEDRRVRKDLQDVYAKLLDSVVVSVNRNADQSFWSRRGLKDGAVNGRDSPAPRGVLGGTADERLEEKANASTASLPLPSNMDASDQYISTDVLPHLRQFLTDNDKVLVACTNIMYYIVSPAIKSKSRPLDVEVAVLQIVKEMSQISLTLKTWRGVVAEIINDNRFFACTPDMETPFRPAIQAWIKADKSAFSEVIGKVTTGPSTNIFSNREYENLMRSLALRRMSYLLLCGEKNEFLTSLPTIQEKLVDVFRNVNAPTVLAEVFLCIRVLLCRLSAHNLASFWPVILSELYRLLLQTMVDLPPDASEILTLVLSACKFVDLLLVLQTEEFQVHEWAFITDTVDAVYHPDEWSPEAILDQLAEIASQLPAADVQRSSTGTALHLPVTTPGPGCHLMRRPMLTDLKQVDSIRDLIPFFSSASIASYESVYTSGGNIDWAEVERSLNVDIFDGR
ncbi:Dopey, N-terminal-domain-containing protein [Vararia minispora EC-137]|uniref:Dopey, N-terminal-domain-containing protein n=1 Tax=Vararia minispora EC-137 TaxID=1314806 RepID=A0ACB8QHT5_9AGAM|nr:Dopey, N-terminal-domain-containing protein [Vararia minispora EC-137]